MARGTCVSAAADLDRAAKECRNPLGADATKSARPSSIIQIDRNLLETKLDRLVAEKVTEPLNAITTHYPNRNTQKTILGKILKRALFDLNETYEIRYEFKTLYRKIE